MAGFTGAPPIVTDGLVFAVDAANYESYPGSGTTWNNMVGGNNGTLVNGPTFDVGNGGSIVFDGANEYFSFPHDASISTFGDSFTFYVTVKFDSTTNVEFPCIFSKRFHWSQGNQGYALFLDGRNYTPPRFQSSVGIGSTTHVITSNSGVLTNQWYYVTLTYNGSEISSYVNGVKQNDVKAASGNVNEFINEPLFIGIANLSGNPNSVYSLLGNVSFLIMYNISHTPSEILQNYNALKSRFNLD